MAVVVGGAGGNAAVARCSCSARPMRTGCSRSLPRRRFQSCDTASALAASAGPQSNELFVPSSQVAQGMNSQRCLLAVWHDTGARAKSRSRPIWRVPAATKRPVVGMRTMALDAGGAAHVDEGPAGAAEGAVDAAGGGVRPTIVKSPSTEHLLRRSCPRAALRPILRRSLH
jgi:hypothetical protein